ncbi:mycothiol system anti-sigma-R factor [Prauserella marina]|uniref:Mycothiol system anti-sigma-R factor n=1 Tax=Prauserella marina TaxID=530584 RepID=A0A222VVE5_9PSEU|nr:mycothiol system anti-sigma-R factor [Prauserella marina]ASR37898.1 mycothiol system anti-sigma-R factor [Prauserella marina]PWV73102.1 mycothiol system anti-sigma-R factor [Prauserella marina]SDD71782.1 mycothiol system anti-sigma-R factor [Prauserella marina]
MTAHESHERSDSEQVHCDQALAEIFVLLDRECSPERDAELRKHIEDCPPCLEEYGIDEQIKQLLARKCGGDHAPAELKSRLRASIRQTVAHRGGVSVTETELTVEQVSEPRDVP